MLEANNQDIERMETRHLEQIEIVDKITLSNKELLDKIEERKQK